VVLNQATGAQIANIAALSYLDLHGEDFGIEFANCGNYERVPKSMFSGIHAEYRHDFYDVWDQILEMVCMDLAFSNLESSSVPNKNCTGAKTSMVLKLLHRERSAGAALAMAANWSKSRMTAYRFQRAKPHPQRTQIDIREQSRRNTLTHDADIMLQQKSIMHIDDV
jgi:hypothetical protein